MNQVTFTPSLGSRQPVPGPQGRSGTGEAHPQMAVPDDCDFYTTLSAMLERSVETLVAAK